MARVRPRCTLPPVLAAAPIPQGFSRTHVAASGFTREGCIATDTGMQGQAAALQLRVPSGFTIRQRAVTVQHCNAASCIGDDLLHTDGSPKYTPHEQARYSRSRCVREVLVSGHL